MITLSQLTELLGWASIINIAYLLLAIIVITFARGTISSLHSKIFRLDENELGEKYYDFLSNYKIATLVLIVAPYVALKIMGQ